jgi:hypothetical protein
MPPRGDRTGLKKVRPAYGCVSARAGTDEEGAQVLSVSCRYDNERLSSSSESSWGV